MKRQKIKYFLLSYIDDAINYNIAHGLNVLTDGFNKQMLHLFVISHQMVYDSTQQLMEEETGREGRKVGD